MNRDGLQPCAETRAAAPMIRLAVETMPSYAPDTAAQAQHEGGVLDETPRSFALDMMTTMLLPPTPPTVPRFMMTFV